MAEMDQAINAGLAGSAKPSKLHRAAQEAAAEQAQWRHQHQMDAARRLSAEAKAAAQALAEVQTAQLRRDEEHQLLLMQHQQQLDENTVQRARAAKGYAMWPPLPPPLPQPTATAPLSPEEAAARARMRSLAGDAMDARLRRTSLASAVEPAPQGTFIGEEDVSGAAAQRHVQEYMLLLQSVLTSTELRSFAILLRDYRQGQSFAEFAPHLLALYGPTRVHLLPGALLFCCFRP
jgi:hypothetical protein